MADYVYVIQREGKNLYSIRGFIGFEKYCFAPQDIERETFKNFIADTCVPFYYQNTQFTYSLYIEENTHVM